MESDDFFEETPTAVFIRPLHEEVFVEDPSFEAEDLDPAAFCPMATRYPTDL